MMPELPEVETIRRDLQRVLKGRKVARVQVRKEKMVRGSARMFVRALRGRSVASVRRRGKLLVLELSDGLFVMMHLKMTGQLIYRGAGLAVKGGHSQVVMEEEELPNKFTHIIFHFENDGVLYFNDMRQFGYAALADKAGVQQVMARYGVEPLSPAFTWKKLADILRGRKAILKSVLLNQQLIAGLGNIYVDEACWRAGVLPARRADTLAVSEIMRLHRGIRQVLELSLKHRGTTFNSYRDSQGRRGAFVSRLKVYGRAGKSCQRCKLGVIEKIKVGQRGTAFCPKCQV